jgi:hypothetical protein
VNAKAAQRLKRQLSGNSAANQKLLRQAIALREAIHALGRAWSTNTPSPRKAVSLTSACCKDLLQGAALADAGGQLAWLGPQPGGDGSALPGHIA